jgi:ribose transport system substrate-binding protein
MLFGRGGFQCCLLIASLLLSSAGCSSDSSPKTKRLILMTNGNSPYWDAAREGLFAGAKEFKIEGHGLSVEMAVNDGTPKGQIDKLRQFATQSDIVAVGVSVIDAANVAIADEMRKLKARGVHVLAIDSDLDRGKFRDARYAFIGTDNQQAGEQLGTAIRYLRPTGGELVTFVGRTGAQNALERVAGVTSAAGETFKRVDNMGDDMDRTRARENVRNAISNHPKVNVLVGIWSYNGPAIVDVVRQMKRRQDFTIVTFDAEPIAIKDMEQGQLDCMMVQNPFDIGLQMVRLMTALITKNQAEIDKMFPKYGQPEGDLYITGLKLVVPDEGSPLKREMFGEQTEFLKLSDFKAWLAKFGLEGS